MIEMELNGGQTNKCLRIVVFTPLKYSKLRGQKIRKLLQDGVVGWWLKRKMAISRSHLVAVITAVKAAVQRMSDLVLVKDAEQHLGRAQTATFGPSEEQQQTR